MIKYTNSALSMSVIVAIVLAASLVLPETRSQSIGRPNKCVATPARRCRRLIDARAIASRPNLNVGGGPKPMPLAIMRYGKRRDNSITVAEFDTLHSTEKRRLAFLKPSPDNKQHGAGSKLRLESSIELEDNHPDIGEVEHNSILKRVTQFLRNIVSYPNQYKK
uniref:Uncharacterized protein LOC100369537 n=1 Tax=Saccoglossus kowalevskii TaxID=10224 RepID=A0ABM0GX39_SACKO|nr:PREDICTED: uncharacterized protein LOC100369537 [Saccoglossus kowalevskii]